MDHPIKSADLSEQQAALALAIEVLEQQTMTSKNEAPSDLARHDALKTLRQMMVGAADGADPGAADLVAEHAEPDPLQLWGRALREREIAPEARELPTPAPDRLFSPNEMPQLPAVQPQTPAPSLMQRAADFVMPPAGAANPRGGAFDLPTIGVAKSRLVGRHEEPPAERGGRVPLIDYDMIHGDAPIDKIDLLIYIRYKKDYLCQQEVALRSEIGREQGALETLLTAVNRTDKGKTAAQKAAQPPFADCQTMAASGRFEVACRNTPQPVLPAVSKRTTGKAMASSR